MPTWPLLPRVPNSHDRNRSCHDHADDGNDKGKNRDPEAHGIPSLFFLVVAASPPRVIPRRHWHSSTFKAPFCVVGRFSIFVGLISSAIKISVEPCCQR